MVGREEQCVAIVGRLRGGVGAVLVAAAGMGKSTLVGEVARRLEADGWHTALVLCVGGADLLPSQLDELSSLEGRLLVVVDDAHRLDPDSAGVLWRLAHVPGVVLLVTVRSGSVVSDYVARLWTSGRCERSDVGPLSEGDVLVMLEQVLGGDVEDRLVWELTRLSVGNPLYLRELVAASLRTRSIAQRRRVWRQVGPLPVGDGLTDLVRSSLSGLTNEQRTVCEYVALAQPMSLALSDLLLDRVLLEALEERGLVQVQSGTEGEGIALGHPLHAEVLLSELSALRSRRLRLDLVRAIGSSPNPSPHEVVRSAVWRLELGEPIEEAELVRAARLARTRAVTGVTAELLARAAARTGSAESTVSLAEIVLMQGRVVEAEHLLDRVTATSGTTQLPDEMLERIATARAVGRTRLGETERAAALVAGEEGEPRSPLMLALHAQAMMLEGDLDQSVALAGPVFSDGEADVAARTVAGFVLVACAGFTGDYEPTRVWLQTELARADTVRARAPYDVSTLEVTAAIAAATSGHLDEAHVIAQRMRHNAMTADDEWQRPRAAAALGVVALMRGQVRTATKHLRISIPTVQEFDGRSLRFAISYLARAAAVAGLPSEARAAMSDVPREAPLFPVLQTDWETAEAAVLAAEGSWAEAAQVALVAAQQASARGAWKSAINAAHGAVRYTGNRDAAEIVLAAADQLQTPMAAAFARHAQGLVAGDGATLGEAGDELATIGALLHAAEAHYAAARAYRAGGRPQEAVREEARAQALHAQCENADISWIASFPATNLTTRERQVAVLAATGQPDLTIAVQLGISARTVQVHLLRAYQKLGINSRRDLPAALAPV